MKAANKKQKLPTLQSIIEKGITTRLEDLLIEGERLFILHVYCSSEQDEVVKREAVKLGMPFELSSCGINISWLN